MRGLLCVGLLLGGIMVKPAGAEPPSARPIDADDVAQLPYPGTVVPGAIAFAKDGKSATYLKSESNSLRRALWRVTPDQAPARVIARAPGEEAKFSPEEALRRERQRIRDTGLAQIARAEGADIAILPIGGDLYLLSGDDPLVRLTESAAPEIDPKPSRDGASVAFVRGGDLYVVDVPSRRETRLTRGAEDGLSHGLAEFIAQEEMDRQSGFWWSPDGARIAYQETDERHIPLYSIAHQGGADYSVETHRYPFSGKANAKVRLGVIPSAGGETKWLDFAGGEDDAYLARVDWEGPRSLLVQVLSRDQKRLKLVRIDVESGERKALLEETSASWVNLHNDLRTVAATGEILWSSERSGYRHLEVHDRDGKLLRTLTSGDWPVDAVVGLDAARREAWFTAGKESPLESQLYRVSLDGGPIERLTPEPGTHRPVVSPDGEMFVDVRSDRKTPWITTLRDRTGKVLRTIDDAGADPRLDGLDLSPPAVSSFKNRDGVILYGAYYAPKSKRLGEKAPLIVIAYGGPHVQLVADAWGVGSNAAAMSADLMAHYLAGQGFAVWKCDNRGSSRRGLAFESALHLRMGTVEVRDQEDGVRHVTSTHPELDASRVGITGGSYGGYMTLRCLTEAPDVFTAGVAVAPVTDWDGYDTCYTERYMGTPANNADGYRISSVLDRAYSLRGKLLMIHGMLDENVHFRHSARLSSAFLAASRPFEFLPLPDERHSTRNTEVRRYSAAKTAEFFERALGK